MTLIEFLLKRGVLGLYVVNVFNEVKFTEQDRTTALILLTGDYTIGQAFDWTASNEGFNFWSNLRDKYLDVRK